ncbi:YceI family protein [Brevundimonas viscosa]|uniref:Polyisoprenoid-binding protein YceI n=1 Tax=Brevundimonas viscosa TaxID=871741 RepID=A0A1I6QGC5_9CAUL|nr:YceI family protein [Brevundimonas viscosa]SFS51338.1 Polyisoprenoid-binding protein YceI [Brevundimonas viscosa]
MRPVSRIALAGVLSLGFLAAGAVGAQQALTRVPAEVQAGSYKLDPAHGKITWSVDHLGFSTYVGQFVNVQADLTLDPANPANSRLTATIPLTEVDSNSDGLDAHLQTPDFFDTANHPVATFVSRSVAVDSDAPSEATVVGDLTLRGVTRPVTMEVEFNQAGQSMGAYKAGFDGEATIRRSDFGINFALPALGDEVKLHIEGEFVRQ